jgi:hypothetical protein
MKYVKTFESFFDKEEFADTTYHWSADERKQLEQLGFKSVADNETGVYVKGDIQIGKIAHDEDGVEGFYYKIKSGDKVEREDTLDALVEYIKNITTEPIPPKPRRRPITMN